jgi:hypothetical protein
MPNILALTDRVTGERHEGRGLIAVDKRLCEALDVPCDDIEFYEGWVDWMPLYFNEDWDKVRDSYLNGNYDNSKGWVDTRVRVINWLAEHYTLNTYVVIGKR